MVQAAVDYLGDEADKIYIYGASENNYTSAGFFFEKDGLIHDNSQNCREAEKRGTIDEFGDTHEEIFDCVCDAEQLCKEYNKPMPTEIKLIYDYRKGTLDSNIQYENMFSFDETKEPYTMFCEWEEQLKKEKGQI